jgi:hypothetical protein
MRALKFIYTVVKPAITFSSPAYTIEDIEQGKAKKFLDMNGVLPTHEVHKRQYTGEKDRYGNEIYEGDQLNSDMNVVEFSYGCFSINGDHPLFTYKKKDREVVGNIYENPPIN